MNWSAKQKLLKIEALFVPLASGDSVLVGERRGIKITLNHIKA